MWSCGVVYVLSCICVELCNRDVVELYIGGVVALLSC